MTPEQILDHKNDKGYSLHDSLLYMLKMWRECNSKWPVNAGLRRQAKIYGLSLPQIHAAIASNELLNERFSQFPHSGYVTPKKP